MAGVGDRRCAEEVQKEQKAKENDQQFDHFCEMVCYLYHLFSVVISEQARSRIGCHSHCVVTHLTHIHDHGTYTSVIHIQRLRLVDFVMFSYLNLDGLQMRCDVTNEMALEGEA